MPAGVITSHAMSELASSDPGVPKFCTCREHVPAPRSSTGMSAARTTENGTSALAGANGKATRPPPTLVTVRVELRGTYAQSAGPAKTLARPASVSSCSPTCTRTSPPESTSTMYSSSPVSIVRACPSERSATSRPVCAQPGRPGRIATGYSASPSVPNGRIQSLIDNDLSAGGGAVHELGGGVDGGRDV